MSLNFRFFAGARSSAEEEGSGFDLLVSAGFEVDLESTGAFEFAVVESVDGLFKLSFCVFELNCFCSFSVVVEEEGDVSRGM